MDSASGQTIYRQRGSTAEEPSPVAKSALRWLLPLVVASLVAALYVNALRNPILASDIKPSNFIASNEPGSLWPAWINGQGVSTQTDWTAYRPVTTLILAVNAAITGPTPEGFRLGNMAILVALGCALARWVARYTSPTIGWLSALLVVAHPSNVELVNFIMARADTLSMLGVVGFLLAQKAALDENRWPTPRWLLAVVAAVLAIGAKETGVILLPVALAQAWLGHFRKIRPPSLARAHVVTALVLAVVFAGYAYARHHFVGLPPRLSGDIDVILDNPIRHADPFFRVAGGFAVAGRYARQLVYPYTNFDQVPPEIPGWTSPPTIMGMAVFIIGVALTVVAWQRHRWVVLPLVLALANFLLIGNLLFPIGVYAANRLALPFTVAASAVVAAIISRFTENSPRGRAAAMMPCVALVIVMAWPVLIGNGEWSSEIARRGADAFAAPRSPAARLRFGLALREAEQNKRALDEMREASKRCPASILARTELANTYRLTGDLDNAALEYKRSIGVESAQWRAHLMLGEIDLGRGDLAAAEKHLLAAEKACPVSSEPEINLNLAELAYKRGQDHEAIRRYEAILFLDPDHRLARQRLEELRAH